MSAGANGPGTERGSRPGTATYTCPMHPQVVRDAPGACPICGMALEPKTAAPEAEDVELRSMSCRFWFSLIFSIPVVVIAMLKSVGVNVLPHRAAGWLVLALATPVVLWGGYPFFSLRHRATSRIAGRKATDARSEAPIPMKLRTPTDARPRLVEKASDPKDIMMMIDERAAAAPVILNASRMRREPSAGPPCESSRCRWSTWVAVSMPMPITMGSTLAFMKWRR